MSITEKLQLAIAALMFGLLLGSILHVIAMERREKGKEVRRNED